jgi:RNA polymerase sigma factor (sigma-70 family)
MNVDELSLWTRCRQGDETARQELILLYLPLATFWGKKISMIAGWADSQDLKQEGVFGLMRAVERFKPSREVEFKAFARRFIRGAIFESSEFTRDLARRQREIYSTIRRAEDDLTKTLRRNPTIEEVADKTGLTIKQIRNAIDAMGIASAGELPEPESGPASTLIETPEGERETKLLVALSQLNAREQEIIRLYYCEDFSHDEIAQKLGLTISNAIKIRQRAIKKLRKLLGGDGNGGHDDSK